MKSLFWKKVELAVASEQPGASLKFELGSSLTYLDDVKKIVAFGTLKHDSQMEAPKDVKEEPKKSSFSFKGGFSLSEKQAPAIDSLQWMSPATGKWSISNSTGKHPSVRTQHYALYESPHLIIYGGLQKKLLNDMYVLNLRTMSWKKMFSLESPPARLSGAFLQLKDRKYLIGGCKHPETPTDLYGDVWSLSFANVNWEVSASDLPGSVWANVEYNNVDGAFLPLKHFTANAIGEEVAYIFGGFTSNNQPSNREYLFNPHTKEMKLSESKGLKPSPRGKHKTAMLKPNLLVLFGGYPQCEVEPAKFLAQVYIYHTELATWEKPIVGGGLPSELSYFGFSLKNSEGKGQLMLMGCKHGSSEIVQYQLAPNSQEEFMPKPALPQAEKPVQKGATDKKVLREANQRSSIEEELQEGYKMTEQQRNKLEHLEDTLAGMKRENEELKLRLEHSRDSGREELELEGQQNAELSSKVLSLLLMEHKKRRFLEVKSNVLQSIIKDAQRLAVTMDGYSEEDGKVQHIAMVKEFRREMEEIWSKEKALRKEISSRKAGFDLNKLLMDNLSEEESRLMSMF